MADTLTMIKNTGTFEAENANLLRGIMKADAASLALMNPFQSGRHYFVFTRMPEFMQKAFPTETTRFKALVERFSTAFDGIQDMQAQYGEVNGGSSMNKFSYLTAVEDNFDEFTIRMPYDTNTLDILNYLELWLVGMFDPATTFTHYHGKLDEFSDGPSLQHEVAEGIYILLDRARRPIRAAAIYGIMPTKSHKGQLNSEKGSYDAQQIDLSMKGIKREGYHVNKKAEAILKTITTAINYMNYNDSTLGTGGAKSDGGDKK